MTQSKTGESDLRVHSPGRINLIGEHIDYSGGYVLPAAIDRMVTLTLTKKPQGECKIHSKDLDDFFSPNLERLEKSDTLWANYFIGVLYYINTLRPGKLGGFDCEVSSNLPIGSGLSSSAAIECGFASGLNQLFDLHLSEEDIISVALNAEHNFVGTQCGIMDQYAVVKGRQGRFILLDCGELTHEYVSADFRDYKLLLLNSNVAHNLASSEYNVRRKECEAGLAIVQQEFPEIEDIVDIPPATLKNMHHKFPAKVFQRLNYAVAENQRTKAAAIALQQGDLQELGKLLYASHDGLRHLYEVSCPEIDFLVDFSRTFDEVLGARMMGGGFGGCTINLVAQDFLQTYQERISAAYKDKFGLALTPFSVSVADGVTTYV